MKTIKIELKWALIFSAVSLIWMLIEKLTELHSTYLDYHIYLTNLFAIPAITVMVLALRSKKKDYYRQQMSYLQGLISGVVLSAFIALFSPLVQWVTTYVISPEYFPNVIKRSVELGLYKTTALAEANFNYTNYAIQGVIGSLLMGIVTTAVAMLFLKTKNK
ncbi:MAG: DUF4199 domain-containing protein [Paludibacter sp.]|nr:DUF4199 domain-containing protein [Paludibacter sp.]